MSQLYRIFAAIELSTGIRNRIQQHIEQLRAAVPDCQPSWSRVESMHLTVKFFGDVEQSKIAQIADAASRSVKNFSSFQILIHGTGVFPKPSQPRVIWIGVEDPTKQLLRLQSEFEVECAREGFTKEVRPFRPHLTIARIRKPEGARKLAEVNNNLGFETMNLEIKELVVFRSELSSKGSKYTALSRHMIEQRQ